MEMLDKKQIREIFLSEFKMGPEAAETSAMRRMRLAQGLLMSQGSVAPRALVRGGEPGRWGAITRASPPPTTQEATKNSTWVTSLICT